MLRIVEYMFGLIDSILIRMYLERRHEETKDLGITKTIVGSEKTDKLVIFFPYWTGRSKVYESIGQKLKDSTLVYYEYPSTIVSCDIPNSIKQFDMIVNDALNLIYDYAPKKLIIIGSSFGSSIAVKLSTKVNVDKLILLTFGSSIAKTIERNKILQKLLGFDSKHKLSFSKIEKAFKPYSIEGTIKHMKNPDTSVMTFSSVHDFFFPYMQYRPVLKWLKENTSIYSKISEEILFGHLLTIHRHLLFNKQIIDFVNS